jgi:hypothetical protein
MWKHRIRNAIGEKFMGYEFKLETEAMLVAARTISA